MVIYLFNMLATLLHVGSSRMHLLKECFLNKFVIENIDPSKPDKLNGVHCCIVVSSLTVPAVRFFYPFDKGKKVFALF